MEPDLVLLAQWCAGDRDAGQALFARHFREIYRFFEHKVGGDADDLAQRTFLACVAGRERFRGMSSFRTYLFAIARHQLYEHLRQAARRDNVDFGVTSLGELVTSAASRFDRARKAEQLHVVLQELPAEQQLLLELHYWHDLDAAALGEIFATSPGTIRVRLLRARKALRAGLGERGLRAEVDGADKLAASLAAPDDDDPG
jgi:RNA polymerase sigma-70 factor (ECF subfamily)